MLGSLLIGHALRLMPVGETISILHLFPIIVMILAIPLMGEQVSAINWGFAVLGFAGVLMLALPTVMSCKHDTRMRANGNMSLVMLPGNEVLST